MESMGWVLQLGASWGMEIWVSWERSGLDVTFALWGPLREILNSRILSLKMWFPGPRGRPALLGAKGRISDTGPIVSGQS